MSLAIVNAPIAPLYTKPSTDCELADEALYGMVVEYTREAEGWYHVRTHYRYEGYSPAACFVTDPARVSAWQRVEKQVVTRVFADVLTQPKVQGAHVAGIAKGGLVSPLGEPDKDQWQKVQLPDGREGYTKLSFLGQFHTRRSSSREEELRSRLVNTALEYRGAQYRWGGKTPLGIDCSGLTSMAYLLNGVVIHRDASIRPEFEMKQIAPADAKPGDLLFFPGHVAMYLGQGRYVHSTGRAGDDGVVINSLNPADTDFRQDLLDSMTCAGTIF